MKIFLIILFIILWWLWDFLTPVPPEEHDYRLIDGIPVDIVDF